MEAPFVHRCRAVAPAPASVAEDRRLSDAIARHARVSGGDLLPLTALRPDLRSRVPAASRRRNAGGWSLAPASPSDIREDHKWRGALRFPLVALAFLVCICAVCLSSTARLAAQEYICLDGATVVQGAGDRADEICADVAEATQQLASCNLTVSTPVTVEITRAIPGNCYGLYHCGEELIQLRPLEDHAQYLSSDPDSPFGHLEPDEFFRSVLRHELTHAAMGTTPCPFDSCAVTREFVAYTMQIWFLSDSDRAPFDQRITEAERPMTREDLSAIALMMAPKAFIDNAYAYLSQQEDPCSFVGAIERGEVIFDLPYR